MLTPDQARKEARQLLATVRRCEDPAAERKAARKAPTMAELCDRYLSEHVAVHNKPSTAKGFDRLVERHIKPAMGSLKAKSVARRDVIKLHRSMNATPRQANQTLAVLSKMFSLAELWDMRPDGSNPCRHIKRYAEVTRERFLSDAERERLGKTLSRCEREQIQLPGVVNAIRLLGLTGCRLGEVLGMRWEHVDFEASVLRFPDTKTGARVHPVGAPTLAVLDAIIWVNDSPWVLHGAKSGQPLSTGTIESAWRRIRKSTGLEDVRLHDLRHTVGTYAGQTGANAFLVRDKLGHKTLAMTGRYVNRDTDPLRELSDRVEGRVDAALRGRLGADVVELRPSNGKREA